MPYLITIWTYSLHARAKSLSRRTDQRETKQKTKRTRGGDRDKTVTVSYWTIAFNHHVSYLGFTPSLAFGLLCRPFCPWSSATVIDATDEMWLRNRSVGMVVSFLLCVEHDATPSVCPYGIPFQFLGEHILCLLSQTS